MKLLVPLESSSSLLIDNFLDLEFGGFTKFEEERREDHSCKEGKKVFLGQKMKIKMYFKRDLCIKSYLTHNHPLN